MELPFRFRSGEPTDGADGRGADWLNTPLEVLRRFEPRQAGLPEISAGDAAAYLNAHHIERPWLAAARDCGPEVQRIWHTWKMRVAIRIATRYIIRLCHDTTA